MKTILWVLLFSLLLFGGTPNVWEPLQAGGTGKRGYVSLHYSPDSGRFFMTLGAQGDWGTGQPYSDMMFSYRLGKWINFLPDDALYGVWADSTGPARGLGLSGTSTFVSPYFVFKGISYAGKTYLRPNIITPASYNYNQSAYNSDDGKIYFYVYNKTFTYDTRKRQWDTLSPATHPAVFSGGTAELWWGSLCYDPVNKEVLLFGGGNIEADRGNCGTWAFRPADTTWRKLSLATEPPPRAHSPMVFDAANQCIVLFGGDHLDYLTSDTWVYRCAERRWELIAPPVNPPARAGHALVYLPKSKRIALFGGYAYTNACSTFSHCIPYTSRSSLDFWVLDVSAPAWKLIHDYKGADPRPVLQATVKPVRAASDTADRILVFADSALSNYYQSSATWAMTCDPSQTDDAGTASLGVAPGTKVYLGGVWDPSFFITGLSAPDTAANEAYLRSLPQNTWIRVTPPRIPRGNRDWGTAVYDPVNDVLLKWSGGHSAYCGTEMPQYSPGRNRWVISYAPESPLECYGANTRHPWAHSFNNHPFMSGHTYDNYGYDTRLKRLVLVKWNHTYFYDASALEWDSISTINHPEMSGHPNRASVASTPKGAFCWVDPNNTWVYNFFLLDSATRAWRKLPVKGDTIPGYYCDQGGSVYDSKRDRMLIITYMSPISQPGQVWAYTFGDSTLRKLNPANPNGIVHQSSDYIREFVYLPVQDQVFCQTQRSGGQQTYDCASNSWIIRPTALGTGVSWVSSVSSGYMYDERRDLVWNCESALKDLYVIRLSGGRLEGEGSAVKPVQQAGFFARPNPFKTGLSLRLELTEKARISVRVMDAAGRTIAMLADGVRPAGRYAMAWNGADSRGRKLAAGVYLVRAEIGREAFTRRVLLMK